jgi:ribosomal-protein-alanine N-acetyltransferase
MSLARPDGASTCLQAMSEDLLEGVLAIEKTAYSHPWSRGNFLDALRASYWARVLMQGPDLIGYVVAMPGVEETHLLNLTVAQDHQGRGWARHMLDAWVAWSKALQARQVWLEVRASNARARRLYVAYGFHPVGERKNYYPGLGRQRETAVVMRLTLA